MRTTIDLPHDLHQAVGATAERSGHSLSQTGADLIRHGLALAAGPLDAQADTALRLDKRTGLLVFRSPRPVTPQDVRNLGDM